MLDPADVGTLTVATSAEQLSELGELGSSGELLDGEAVRRIEPALSDAVLGGLLQPEGRRVDTGALAAALGAAARAAGVDVRRHVGVRRVRANGGRFAVTTALGEARAERLLLAAGAWTRPLAGGLGHDLPIRPARGWLLLTAPGPPLVTRLVAEAGWQRADGLGGRAPVTLGDLADGRVPEAGAAPDHRFVLHGAASGGLLVGASRSPALHEGAESPQALRGIAARARWLVPELAGREVVAAWSGLRPATPDSLPYVAELTANAVVCAGHGSQGILTGPGSARLAVDLLLGRTPFADPAPFRLERPPA